jgi:hypothetical protein
VDAVERRRREGLVRHEVRREGVEVDVPAERIRAGAEHREPVACTPFVSTGL